MDTPTPLVPAPVVPPAQVLLPAHHIRWKLISAIFVVALFAGFEAYYFINKSIPEAVIPVFTPRPTSTVPADWKTYWNRQYGFEIKYPISDTTYEKNGEALSVLIDATEKIQQIKEIEAGPGGGVPNVLLIITTEKTSRQIDTKCPDGGSITTRSIVGITAATCIYIPSEGPNVPRAHLWMQFTNNGLLVTIQSEIYEETNKMLVDQILSTFKFSK